MYKPLSGHDLKVIHEASLQILENTGFTFESGLDDTLVMLEGAGATVDREAVRIYFPRGLVMAQADRAPARVVLYSRDGQNDLDLSDDRVHLGTGGAAIKLLDLTVNRHAAMMAYDDVFWMMGMLFLVSLPFLCLLGSGRPKKSSPA